MGFNLQKWINQKIIPLYNDFIFKVKDYNVLDPIELPFGIYKA